MNLSKYLPRWGIIYQYKADRSIKARNSLFFHYKTYQIIPLNIVHLNIASVEIAITLNLPCVMLNPRGKQFDPRMDTEYNWMPADLYYKSR